MKLTWNRARVGGTVHYVSGHGHRVKRVRENTDGFAAAIWLAYRPGERLVRVTTNADGSPYIERPWHTGADMPVEARFPTAAAAKRFLEKELAE